MTLYVPEWLLWVIVGVVGIPLTLALILCYMMYKAHNRD